MLKKTSIFILILISTLAVCKQSKAQCSSNFLTTSPICLGSTSFFTDESIVDIGDTIISWSWDFGDGVLSNDTNPNHTYLSAGFYTVELSIITNLGCLDTSTQIIEVLQSPDANFSFIPDTINCTDEFIDFTNTSIGAGLTYQWTFGNGSTSNDESPTHTLPGIIPNSCSGLNYNNKLVVTNDLLCSDSITQSVYIRPRPSAEVAITTSFICATIIGSDYEAELELFNMATSPCLDSYIINWGDGTVETVNSALPNFTHTYTSLGSFNIEVHGTAFAGSCTTIIFRDTLVIEIEPTAGIIGPSPAYISGCVPFTTYFILNSDVSLTTTQTVIWADLDTVILPTTIQKLDTVWHTFTTSGCNLLGVMTPYNVVLTTENLCGISSTTWSSYSVHRPPIAQFNVPDTVCMNDLAVFQNTTNRNLCGGWNNTRFDWNISKNGTTVHSSFNFVSDANPLPDYTYVFGDTGVYTITLTATDNGTNGCGSTIATNSIFVRGAFANFFADTVCLGNPTSFTNLSYSSFSSLSSSYWNFGDGNTSTQDNPTHIFATPGIHNVILIVSDADFCRDTIVKQVLVITAPVADFSHDTVCIGSSMSFTDLSTPIGSIEFWEWDFGDSFGTSLLQNPTYTYTDYGSYNVTLIIGDSLCTDTISKIVYVSPFPVADFVADTVCFGDTTRFSDFSFTIASDNIVDWSWDFGDGNSSNQQEPTHVYGNSGFFNVTLVVTTLIGCTDTATRTIYVSPYPIADFTSDTICFGNETLLTDLSSTIGIDTLSGWEWVYGGLTISNNQNTSYVFPTIGQHSTTLIVTNNFGCSDTTTNFIEVLPSPIAIFTFDTVCIGSITNFTDYSTPIGSVDFWNWDFGDAVGTSNSQNPSYEFNNSGYFNVTLIVGDTICADTLTRSVYVSPNPTADFFADTVCLGAATSFSDMSNTSAIDSIVFWEWDFGDGNISNLQDPTNLYLDTGIFNVTLIISSALGCSDTISKDIFVAPYPIADFTADTSCIGFPTSFTDLSTTISIDNITDWEWYYLGTLFSNDTNPVYIFPTSGFHDITLVIYSNFGCADSILKTIYVAPMPSADFTSDTVCLGLATSFIDLSSTSANDSIISWEWYYLGVLFSNDTNPTFIFPASGFHDVTLIVGSGLGCTDTITNQIFVSQGPVADFTADTVCLGSPTIFNDISSTTAFDIIIDWQWDFGDGDTSMQQNPIHFYADTGLYNVCLITNTDLGCTDTICKSVYVSSLHSASFISDTVCVGNTTTFTDLSLITGSDSIIGWEWHFGDGDTALVQHPTHIYPDSGFYNVTLIVTTAYGCSDTIIQPIYVYPLPEANAGVNLEICFGDSIQLNATGGVIYEWSPQTALNNINISNPIASPTITSTYTVVVTDLNGCINSDSTIVTVNPLPIIDAGTDLNICIGDIATLVVTGLPGSTFLWSTGDITDTIYSSPIVTTTYTVTATDMHNCGSISDQVVVYVNHLPTAYAGEDISICGGESVMLSATGPTGASYLWSTLETTQSIYVSPATTTTYYVSVTDQFSCGTATDSVVVTFFVNPIALFSHIPDSNIFSNELISFINNSINATTYFWDFGDGSNTTQTNPYHIFSWPGIYDVMLITTSNDGCIDTANKTLYVIEGLEIPNVFTPNGDGHNDIFQVLTSGAVEYNLQVFNRWGVTIYESNSTSIHWDGRTLAGEIAPSGTYFYTISTRLGAKIHQRTGTITLLR